MSKNLLYAGAGAMALLALAAASSCVMPGTQASVVWNPTTKQFEGRLSRSWLSGPVDMELEASNQDGSTMSLHWHSEVSTKDAADASKAQSALIETAIQAGLELSRAAVPTPTQK